MKGLKRRELDMACLERENPALYLVENLVSFAHRQDDRVFHTHSQVPFCVEVPLDMIRKNKGFSYILKSSGQTQTEPLSVLTEVAVHYLLTRSFNPSEYSKVTRNADFTLALLSQFVKQIVHNHADEPPEHDTDVECTPEIRQTVKV